MLSDDMADACVFLMGLADDRFASLIKPERPPLINIGCGRDITIRELAETIAELVGFSGRLIFDASKPDGTPRKLLDVSRINALGWRARIALEDGLQQTYRWFLAHEETLRA